MFNNGDPVSDFEATEAYRDAHPECIECGKVGCIAAECPCIDTCDHPVLVKHEREHMHAGCVAAFDRHVENKCDGTTCFCSSEAA